MYFNKNFKRDGLHETPRATPRTPTARELRLLKREARRVLEKSTTETVEINKATEEEI